IDSIDPRPRVGRGVALGEVEIAGAVEGERVRELQLVPVDGALHEGLRLASSGIEPHDCATLEIDVVQEAVRAEDECEREAAVGRDPNLDRASVGRNAVDLTCLAAAPDAPVAVDGDSLCMIES